VHLRSASTPGGWAPSQRRRQAVRAGCPVTRIRKQDRSRRFRHRPRQVVQSRKSRHTNRNRADRLSATSVRYHGLPWAATAKRYKSPYVTSQWHPRGHIENTFSDFTCPTRGHPPPATTTSSELWAGRISQQRRVHSRNPSSAGPRATPTSPTSASQPVAGDASSRYYS